MHELYLLVGLQFCKFAKCGVSVHCHYVKVNSEVFVTVVVLYLDQKDLLKNYLYSIGSYARILFRNYDAKNMNW